MPERIKQIPKQLLEYWKNLTSKQKTIIISIAAVIILTVALLAYFLTRPRPEILTSSESVTEATKVVDALENGGIKYTVSKDSKTIYVDKKDYSNALLILGRNDIPSIGMTTDELLNNGFSTTESEKKLKKNLFQQDKLRTSLIGMDGIENAVVYISDPKEDASLLAQKEETSVSVFLTVTSAFTQEMADAIANILAGAVGNKTTNSIRITDQSGRLWFNGAADDTLGGSVTSLMDYKEKFSNTKKAELYKMLVALPMYDDAEIAQNFAFDMDKVVELYTEYTPMTDSETGVPNHTYTYKAQNATSSGGTPGTTSNDGTSYQMPDVNANDGKVEIADTTYDSNKRETTTEKEVGAYIPEDSSLSITLKSYRNYKEEDLKQDGTLDNMTFEEFMVANQDPVALTVDDSIKDMVSKATGIDAANISMMAYQYPIFQAAEETPFNISNYLMIGLAVLIIALLIFVVFKGTKPVEVTELEPELSVEQLLATTKENQSLDDIEFSDKSETRKLIEKFVDENPDAVAQLLRNWLNEDWG